MHPFFLGLDVVVVSEQGTRDPIIACLLFFLDVDDSVSDLIISLTGDRAVHRWCQIQALLVHRMCLLHWEEDRAAVAR
jgi:hypothetical protein